MRISDWSSDGCSSDLHHCCKKTGNDNGSADQEIDEQPLRQVAIFPGRNRSYDQLPSATGHDNGGSIAVLDATGRPHFRPGIIEEPPPATRDVVKFQIQAMRLLGGYGVADQVFRLEDTENEPFEAASRRRLPAL